MRHFSRRKFMASSAAAAGAFAFPMPSIAQNAPLKVGLLTVKTGPLAAGGVHVEEGVTAFLKDKNFKLSGRKVELIVADTGGNPAGAKNKAQELVERDNVDIVLGPFAAFELLATVGYLAEHKMPTLAFAGAEDVTQRKGNRYLTRTSYTSAQCLYPLADYVAQRDEAEARHHDGRRFRLRLRAGRRLPARARRRRRPRRQETVVAAQHARTMRPTSRRFPTATWCAKCWRARTRSSSPSRRARSASRSRWSAARPSPTTPSSARSATRRSA